MSSESLPRQARLDRCIVCPPQTAQHTPIRLRNEASVAARPQYLRKYFLSEDVLSTTTVDKEGNDQNELTKNVPHIIHNTKYVQTREIAHKEGLQCMEREGKGIALRFHTPIKRKLRSW